MAIDFIEKEVDKVRERFNQTYGVMVVCNLNHRHAAILSIINMGMLCAKVTAAKSKDNARQDIQQFIRIRDTLNNHFNMLEQHLKERRGHVRSNIDERRNAGRCGSLRKLRQRVQG
jgi:hypothetical protein